MIVMLPAATSRGIIPAPAHRALRGLIHAWHAARGTGQPEISQHIRDPLIREPALPRHRAERGNFLLPRATVTVW